MSDKRSIVNQFLSPETMNVAEGRGIVSHAKNVFYNPRMNLNRDLAVLFVRAHFRKPIRICDPTSGSGVRSIRYVLECENVHSVVAGDKSPEAAEATRRTILANKLDSKISAFEFDANQLMLTHGRFDLIDLDPFGSPAPFYESAARSTIDGGVIAATATDMAPLSGARPAACFRKYGVRSFRTEFEKEMAVRILAACLAAIASRLELGVELSFSHATDHYARIYATVRKGKAYANESVETLGYLEYCSRCLRRTPRKTLELVWMECEGCRSRTRVAGPVWLGQLWKRETVEKMIEHAPNLISPRLSEVQETLTRIEEELDGTLFHYRTDLLSNVLGVRPPKLERVCSILKDEGFEASRTHFHPSGFRTNAPNAEVFSILLKLSKKVKAKQI